MVRKQCAAWAARCGSTNELTAGREKMEHSCLTCGHFPRPAQTLSDKVNKLEDIDVDMSFYSKSNGAIVLLFDVGDPGDATVEGEDGTSEMDTYAEDAEKAGLPEPRLSLYAAENWSLMVDSHDFCNMGVPVDGRYWQCYAAIVVPCTEEEAAAFPLSDAAPEELVDGTPCSLCDCVHPNWRLKPLKKDEEAQQEDEEADKTDEEADKTDKKAEGRGTKRPAEDDGDDAADAPPPQKRAKFGGLSAEDVKTKVVAAANALMPVAYPSAGCTVSDKNTLGGTLDLIDQLTGAIREKMASVQ
jgi:hypothetical protein